MRLFRKFASAFGSFMRILTPVLSFPRFLQTPEISKHIAMPLLRFRLAEDLSTLSRVEAKVQLWGSLQETSWQRPFALEALSRCARAHSPGTLASRTRALTRRRDIA